MNWKEYKEFIKTMPETKGLELTQAIMWLHPERLPLGVASLGTATGNVIKIPRHAVNRYKNKVPVIAIAGSAFRGNENITDIILHSDISRIPKGAFAGCKGLERITIPKSIRYIAEGTFDECERLSDVYYEGTPEEWNAVKIVHQRHEIEFGGLIPGTPVERIDAERLMHVPGNDALYTCNLHFRCNLGPEALQYLQIKAEGKDITNFFRTM